MRQTFFLAAVAGCVALAAGGEKALAREPLRAKFLETYVKTGGFSVGRPVRAKVTPDGRSVLFLRSDGRGGKLRLFEFDVKKRKSRELLTPESLLKGAAESLSPEEKARRERQRVKVGGFTNYQLSPDGRYILLSLSGKLYLYDRQEKSTRELKTPEGTLLDPKLSPDGKAVSYVRDHDVYVYDLSTDKEHAVTTGGTGVKSHGLAEFVAQEEMRRYAGYWWSPDARFIAYQESDASEVEVWHVADSTRPGREPLKQFYPRPGGKNVAVRLGVVPAAGGEAVWVEWDRERFEYLAHVNWPKRGLPTVTVQDRPQQSLRLLAFDPATGQTSELLTENDPAFLNLHQGIPKWIDGERGFLWVANTPTGPALELRKPTGERERTLADHKVGFRGLAAYDAKAGVAYFEGGTDPTGDVFYKVPLSGGDPEPITEEGGLHGFAFGKDFSLRVHTTESLTALPKTVVERADGSPVGELPSASKPPGFTPSVTVEKVGRGLGYYTAVIRPADFDASKKYPVIVSVYGGPLSQTVRRSMRSYVLKQWMADQGFIVVSIDNRGTPNRGRDWERAVYRDLGGVPIDDQVRGLRALGKKHPELDLDRVGIYGWSFGGYMSALAVLKRPDVYKAAVAGAPVTDWGDYDTHYTERYMGLLPTGDSDYESASLLPLAGRLRRPLVLIHGTADDNVYFRHTLRLTEALLREGRDFEVLPLPRLTHQLSDARIAQRVWAKVIGHFREHLGRPQ